MESSHLHEVAPAEAAPEVTGQILGQTADQGFSVARTFLAALLGFDDAPPDFPVGGRHHCVDAVHDRDSRCSEYSYFANQEIRISRNTEIAYPSPMVLKPQDLLVVLKLWVSKGRGWTYPALGKALKMSTSEVHGAVKRAHAAGLLLEARAESHPNPEALREFLIHGVRYAFAPDRGEMTRGMPTAHGAPPLLEVLQASGEPVPVWPDMKGAVRGQSFSPIYRSAPDAAREDPALYELLALVDAMRGGRARDRQLAKQALMERIR